VSVYDLGTSTIRQPSPELGSCAAENKCHLRGNLDLQVALVLSSFFCVFFSSITYFRRSRWPRGLRSLAFWDCGFDSRQWHGCLSVVSVVCCHVEVSASS